MDCTRFEQLLDLIVAGELDREGTAAAEAHRDCCSRCRELFQLARGELEILSPEAREALRSSILAATSGPICPVIEVKLVERLDGVSTRDDEEIVSHHLEHCDSCRPLSATLEQMQLDLPLLAEIAPDGGFVSDVLATTLDRNGWRQRYAGRIGLWWNHQIHRPRFAMEFAFSGAMILLLLFGTPSSPLHELPPRAIAVARANPVRSTVELLEEGNASLRPVAAGAGRAVENAGGPVVRGSLRLLGWVSMTAGKIWGVAAIAGSHLESIPVLAVRGEFVEAWNQLVGMWSAMGDRWREGVTASEEESTEP